MKKRSASNHSVKGGKDLLFQVQCFEFDLLSSSGSQSVSESASKPDPDTDPDPEYSVNPSLMGYIGEMQGTGLIPNGGNNIRAFLSR
jgi:hypothetical protein